MVALRGPRQMLLAGALAAFVVAIGAVLLAAPWRTRPGVSTEAATIVSVVVRDAVTADVVYLAGEGNGCGEPAGVQVDERADEVVLTARVRYVTTGERRVCSLVGTQQRETVTLRRPLGDRRVVDGSTGRVVPRAPAPTPSKG